MRVYELIFIVEPEVEGDALTEVVHRINSIIERSGGRILRLDSWGLRRLAYPIRDQWDGRYTLMYLGLEPHTVAELDASLRMIEPIMRHLIVVSQDKVSLDEEAALPDAVTVEQADEAEEASSDADPSTDDEAVSDDEPVGNADADAVGETDA